MLNRFFILSWLTEKMRLGMVKCSNLKIALYLKQKHNTQKDAHFFGILRQRTPNFPKEILGAALRAKNAIAFFGLIVFSAGGCILLDNQGVSTLQEFSNNQKEIEKYLEEQEEFFNKLIDDFKNERLKPGISRENFVCIYGEPICSHEAAIPPAKEIILYRHPTKYFSSDKIYLYFDGSEKLIRWEYKPHK